jgi:hypothetical protein
MAVTFSRDNYMIKINDAYKQKVIEARRNPEELAFTMGSMLRIAEILPASELIQGVPKMIESAEFGCTICLPDKVDHVKDLTNYYKHVLKHLERIS